MKTIAEVLKYTIASLLMAGGIFLLMWAYSHAQTVQVFTSSGTYTPTTGTSYIKVRLVGGGGGGGSGANTTFQNGGGGSGAYCEGLFSVDFASTTVTIGSAGSAGSNSNGGNGGETSLGSYLIGAGGQGGKSGGNNGTGGTGGDCSGTALTFSMNDLDGDSSYRETGATPDLYYSGRGADNPFGLGGQGITGELGTAMAGTNGKGKGTGGGGSLGNTTAGAGVAGVIVIEEYSTPEGTGGGTINNYYDNEPFILFFAWIIMLLTAWGVISFFRRYGN